MSNEYWVTDKQMNRKNYIQIILPQEKGPVN